MIPGVTKARLVGAKIMMTDPLADMLTRIRNASSAGHTKVDIPASRTKQMFVKF